MSTRTLPVTAASFEKIFAAIAIKRTLRRESRCGQIATLAPRPGNAATWREIAWEALEGKKLGDTLRRAIHALSVECREVLFLQDVKNLNTAETAWVLDITLGAARSRLLRARMNAHNALTSGLQPKSSEKSAHFDNFCAHENSANLKIRERNRVESRSCRIPEPGSRDMTGIKTFDTDPSSVSAASTPCESANSFGRMRSIDNSILRAYDFHRV